MSYVYRRAPDTHCHALRGHFVPAYRDYAAAAAAVAVAAASLDCGADASLAFGAVGPCQWPLVAPSVAYSSWVGPSLDLKFIHCLKIPLKLQAKADVGTALPLRYLRGGGIFIFIGGGTICGPGVNSLMPDGAQPAPSLLHCCSCVGS